MSVSNPQSPTPPLHAEVRAALTDVLLTNIHVALDYGQQDSKYTDELIDEICQAVADALLSELPKAIDSVEVDVEATRRHMESKGATENQILNMEIEADDRHDVLKDALDAVTRVIGELRGRRNHTTEKASGS